MSIGDLVPIPGGQMGRRISDSVVVPLVPGPDPVVHKCKTCSFWHPATITATVGGCRYASPEVGTQVLALGVWPITTETDGCGKHSDMQPDSSYGAKALAVSVVYTTPRTPPLPSVISINQMRSMQAAGTITSASIGATAGCETCTHRASDDSCHKSFPVARAGVQDGRVGVWPVVDDHDWCSMYLANRQKVEDMYPASADNPTPHAV